MAAQPHQAACDQAGGAPACLHRPAGQSTPFGVPGNKASGLPNSYKLILITRIDSPYKEPKDLAGKKIAHTTPTSNSGNLAPRALFPALGLTPEKDYEVVFSNGHERSVMGVMHGFYPGAAVASDLYQRMVVKGDVRGSSIRTSWERPPFMTETWSLGKDVSPELQARVKRCSFSESFSPNLCKLLPGNDTFLPINFERDFATVMEVYRKTRQAQAWTAPKAANKEGQAGRGRAPAASCGRGPRSASPGPCRTGQGPP